jgi:hypothetical protein
MKNKKEIEKTRICPHCKNKITHSTSEIRKSCEGKPCRKCSAKLFGLAHTGKNNPFFNKKHSSETKKHIKDTWYDSDARKKNLAYKKTDEYKQYMKENFSGENNPRYGLGSLKDIWIRKLGEIDGNKRFEEWRILQIEKAPKGKDSYMFGKPSPKGSGNGWSGWYKEWFFRSIGELSYMIKEIEEKKLYWENGEQNKYCVSYTNWEGKSKNYFPDFIVDNKYMIECKPKKLHNSVNVLSKMEAAIIFCEKNNLQYILVEPEKLTIEEVKKLYIEKKIIFIERYEKKFLQKYF